jgi:general secretion pathway protein D
MRRAVAAVILLLAVSPLAWGGPAPRPAGPPELTIDLVGVPLADALSALARAAHVDLVVQGEMSGTVTVHLARQTFDQALAILQRAYRLDVRRVGATYVVRQLPEAASIVIAPPQAQSEEIVIRTYHLRHALASDVAEELRQLLGIAPSAQRQAQSLTIGQPPQPPTGGGASGLPSAAGAPGIQGGGGASGPSAPPAPSPAAPSPPGGGGSYGPSAPSPPAGAPSAPRPGGGLEQPAGAGGAQAQRAPAAVASDDRTNSVVVAAPYAVQLQVQEAIQTLDRPESGPGIVTPGGREGPGDRGEPVTGQTYRYEVRYADPGAMASAILAEVPEASVLTDARTNTLLVTGPASVQRRVAALLRALDVPARQILIQSEILDLSKSAASQLGIQWTWQPFTVNQVNIGGTVVLQQPGGGSAASGGIVPIVATLNALVSKGEGKVLANPQVATQEGVQAQITVGQTLYVPITQVTNGIATTTLTQINAGILLLDTPRVNSPGEVTNSLNVQANSISGFTPQGYPNISQRSVSSIITVGDGQPILIGGLISDTTTQAMMKVPLLGDLPLIGSLFRFSQSQEQYDNIVVILTPHIIAPRAGVPLGSSTAAGR